MFVATDRSRGATIPDRRIPDSRAGRVLLDGNACKELYLFVIARP
jgi:hypothetical protein